uniref:Perilipin n=1 Tax=Geotrypetes seraphini TaxID=260995 RepID=A0A6P8NXK5_GEOSA|nr:perilipin-2-like isoform X2 [Geotrypetes seraphini]
MFGYFGFWRQGFMKKMDSEVAEQNVVTRVSNLPLVSSTCDMVSSAYTNTKENLQSTCEVAEKGAKNITDEVLASAKPLVQKLEPQIALANDLARMGLDKIEEKLPILCKPTDEVDANATDMVADAKEAVRGTVTGAITGVVDKSKGAVQGSMEMTTAAVSSTMNTILESHMMQMVSTGVDAALTKSEALVDQYLPVAEEEAAKEATKAEGLETGTLKPIYIRLGSLSSEVRRHAYEQALNRVRDAKQESQQVISKLHNTIELITSSALATAQDLSSQLQTNYLALVANIQGLPQSIQNQAHYVSYLAEDINQNFHSASFRDVSDQLLTTIKEELNKIEEFLEELMDYLANNTPLTWLVSPDCMKHKGEQEEQTLQQE